MSENKPQDMDKIWMKRIRNLAGLMGMILPWVSLLGAILVARTEGFPEGFWDLLSISETYYVTPPLVGILTTAAVVLMCYKGYSTKDHVISALAGLFGLMIVLFHCNCPAASEIVGFFQLPVKISNIIHCASAIAFFLLLSYMSLCQFTQGKDDTRNKHIKNIIFKICGIGMLASLALMVIPVEFFAKTFIVEAIALTFFGVSWLVKGEFLGLLSDEKSN
jgi:hypothetical protein